MGERGGRARPSGAAFVLDGGPGLGSGRRMGHGSGAMGPHQRYRRNIDFTMVEWIAGMKLDTVIRYETLDADFQALPFYNGQPERLPVVNRKPDSELHRSIEELTPQAVEAINEWCPKDFEMFGYKMRQP